MTLVNGPAVPTAREVKAVLASLRTLLDYVDQETCQHDDTHRGGVIWTICDGCGKKWADDEGGFVPYSDPPAVAQARAFLEATEQGERG
jgi:ribosomal protein L37AE/L43A